MCAYPWDPYLLTGSPVSRSINTRSCIRGSVGRDQTGIPRDASSAFAIAERRLEELGTNIAKRVRDCWGVL